MLQAYMMVSMCTCLVWPSDHPQNSSLQTAAFQGQGTEGAQRLGGQVVGEVLVGEIRAEVPPARQVYQV